MTKNERNLGALLDRLEWALREQITQGVTDLLRASYLLKEAELVGDPEMRDQLDVCVRELKAWLDQLFLPATPPCAEPATPAAPGGDYSGGQSQSPAALPSA